MQQLSKKESIELRKNGAAKQQPHQCYAPLKQNGKAQQVHTPGSEDLQLLQTNSDSSVEFRDNYYSSKNILTQTQHNETPPTTNSNIIQFQSDLPKLEIKKVSIAPSMLTSRANPKSPRLQPDLYSFDTFIKAATLIQKIYRGHRSRRNIIQFNLMKRTVKRIEQFFLLVKEKKRKKLKECQQNIELGAKFLIKQVKDFEREEHELKKYFNQRPQFLNMITKSRRQIQEFFAKFIRDGVENYNLPRPEILASHAQGNADPRSDRGETDVRILKMLEEINKLKQDKKQIVTQFQQELQAQADKYNQLKAFHKESLVKYINGIRELKAELYAHTSNADGQ